VTSPEEIWAFGPGLEKVPWLEARLNPPLAPLGPPEAPIESEYVTPGEYPEEGVPERVGVTVGEVEEWHEPAPQPSVELVFPELLANAVSGTAISKSIRKVPTIIILVFILPSSTISHQFLYWLHQRGLSDWSDASVTSSIALLLAI
jgi:hypothetical protein